VRAGEISPADLVSLFCYGPRKVLGLQIPIIKTDEPANLTVFHPDETWQVNPSEFFSKSRNTPFKDWTLTGRSWGIIHGRRWAGRITPAF
jgi:dihydroorotase